MGRNGREWGGRYSGIRAGSGEFLEETGGRDVGGRKGLQVVHFRQGGDWSMWDPLALLTGHVWSLK